MSPELTASAMQRSRSIVGRTLGVASIAALLAWVVFLRPYQLGGPAAYIIVSGVSMEPTYKPGALVLATRQASYSVGDVIVYRVPDGDIAGGSEVIHRIVGGSAADGYVVRGDNTDGPDRWNPRAADVIGKAAFAMPAIGPLLGIVRNPFVVAAIATLTAVSWVLGAKPKPSTATGPASPPDPAS